MSSEFDPSNDYDFTGYNPSAGTTLFILLSLGTLVILALWWLRRKGFLSLKPESTVNHPQQPNVVYVYAIAPPQAQDGGFVQPPPAYRYPPVNIPETAKTKDEDVGVPFSFGSSSAREYDLEQGRTSVQVPSPLAQNQKETFHSNQS
ncbi:hypothetical protein HDU79_002054 [Rhizoclosmatium sp. JEL0117]|nr:hypothetical protein HDU79_002054 [Rhizoclosmatium sp. JEL0117]